MDDTSGVGGLPAIDVVIPAYNEEAHIARCLDHVLRQDYPAELMRVWVIDAGSQDRTLELLTARARVDSRLTVIAGNGRLSPGQAMNIGIDASTASLFARVDAHSYVEPDYLRRGVEALASDERIAVAGGQPEQEGDTRFGEALALARSTRFGVGDSVFSERSRRKYVDTVSLGIFRRTAVAAVGGFHADPAMSEDDELNWRLRGAGHLILLDRTIRFRYTMRPSWRGAFDQYHAYGVMRARALLEHPDMLRARHLAPSGALVVLAATAVACPMSRAARRGLGLAGVTYLAAAALAAGRATGRAQAPLAGHAIAAFAALHAGYGIGLIAGFLRFARPARDG